MEQALIENLPIDGVLMLDLSHVFTTDLIEELEAAWAGSVADFGDPRAALAIRTAPGYTRYRNELVAALRQQLGRWFFVYRAMPFDDYESMLDGSSLGPKGFTLSLEVAIGWYKLAHHETEDELVVVQVKARPEWTIMRGKASEAELVMATWPMVGQSIELVTGR